ncbi:MAG: CBS domain-containing protein [Bacteroidota bacterium]|jgi:predicted transcriptional regulator|nr:CBS domain-containing protein [Bacteroidota bacterium]
MLTRDLITNSIPYLHPDDVVSHSLQLMHDNNIDHLPVVDGNKFLGILTEEQLSLADDNDIVKDLRIPDSTIFVQADDHFLKAIQIAVVNKISFVPVIEEDQIIGLVTYNDLLRNASEFLSLNEPGGLIVLEMEGKDYSFAEISRIVESNDAQITQLNTYTDTESGVMQVTIKVTKIEISDIISTFQRYEYNVKYYFGEELYTNELKDNFDNLMHYLKI